MIAGVECCQDVRRTVRVACRCVEVDHAVERAAAADPLVDGLTLLLLLRVVGVTQGTLRLDPITLYDSTGNEFIASAFWTETPVKVSWLRS